MTDQLFLSIWLERHARQERLRHFEKLLAIFPFSQQEQPQSTISVQAVDSTEPPLLERPVNGPVNSSEIASMLGDSRGEDVSYHVESWWDLWHLDGGWKLSPARVILSCFGPDFDNGTGRNPNEQEDLRIDFGVDSRFLPQPELIGSGRLIESNVKSLIRLVHEVESTLPVSVRRLETESGENFADRLQQALATAGGTA